MGRQGRDVGRAFAQRRQPDRKDRQAIPQVLAEPTVADHFRHIAVGRGHDPDVNVQLPFSAHALERAVLEDPQQPDLGGRGELAAFVEKKRAAVGPLEPPLPRADRTGEAAALVAEELRVDQVRGGWRRS